MSSTPATDDDAQVFRLLVADIYEAAGVLRRNGESIAAAAGQTQARWQLLSVVSDGDWTVPMAADRLGTSRQAVQRIANELAEEGLLEFAANPRHQRSPFMRLTVRGAGTLVAITREADRVLTPLVAGLAPLDLPALRAQLRELTRLLKAQTPDPG